MTKHLPPVPPDNRSDKGPGDSGKAQSTEAATGDADAGVPERPDEVGHGANIAQNTRNQGYQQDR